MTAQLPADFADLLLCLGETGAEYLVVGGYAVSAHGYLRATEDLDIWVRPTPENAQHVLRALDAFGMPPGIHAATLSTTDGEPPTGFRFGRRPLAVDLLTSVRGISFDEAWAGRTILTLGDMRVPVIGIKALIRNKLSTGRLKDRADVEELRRLLTDDE